MHAFVALKMRDASSSVHISQAPKLAGLKYIPGLLMVAPWVRQVHYLPELPKNTECTFPRGNLVRWAGNVPVFRFGENALLVTRHM